MQILPDISRSKGNQTMKFRQCNMRDIFPEKSQNVVLKLVSDAFLKYRNWTNLWINSLEILYSLFSLYVQVQDYQNILKLRCQPLAFISYTAFLKNKKKSGTSLPTSFPA